MRSNGAGAKASVNATVVELTSTGVVKYLLFSVTRSRDEVKRVDFHLTCNPFETSAEIRERYCLNLNGVS